MGPDGKKYVPFLTTMFFFIFFSNIFEVIPFIQFPANARMAVPIAMALMVWVIYNFLGVKNQGFFGYIRIAFSTRRPKALYIIVTPIEFFSVFIIRPLSLAIRLWANMVAGHLLLVTFAVLSATLWDSTYVGAVAPAAMLILMTGFEILVSFLQAFIFTILTAVYMGGAIHQNTRRYSAQLNCINNKYPCRRSNRRRRSKGYRRRPWLWTCRYRSWRRYWNSRRRSDRRNDQTARVCGNGKNNNVLGIAFTEALR